MNEKMMEGAGAVFVQTNEPRNRVLAFARDEMGGLAERGSYETGAAGTGAAHLPSQGSVVLSQDRRFLLVANAGSSDVTVFRVDGARLERVGTTVSGGETPRSIAERDGTVYVLNTGKPSIAAFRLSDGGLEPLVGGETPLSAPDADPAQIGFAPDGSALFVTERGTDAIESFAVRADGSLPVSKTTKWSPATTSPVTAPTPAAATSCAWSR